MNENICSIIQAAPCDAKGMKECVVASYSHYIPRTGLPPGPMFNDYHEMIDHHQAFVIKDNKKVIAILVLMKFSQSFLLDNVAVHPEYQGKGLGKMLIHFAERQAIKQGYSKIYLYTHALMTENITLYESLGFIETQRRFEKGRPRVYMCKILN